MNRSNFVTCHVIAGPLGVGKTSAILDLLQSKATQEFIAVLTNDFGSVGIDNAIIKANAERPSVNLVNVPGGCICCTSSLNFERGLEQIVELPQLDRIIIEPSGLTLLDPLCDLLERLCRKFGFVFMPVILLINPAEITRSFIEEIPYWNRMVHRADILVANRCDRCSLEDIEHFDAWSHDLQPPKLRIIKTTFGKLPIDMFQIKKANKPLAFRQLEDKIMEPHTRDYCSDGQICDRDIVFSSETILQALKSKELLRFKGLFHTDQGWKIIELAQGEIFCRTILPQENSCAEWVIKPGSKGIDIQNFIK